MASIPKLKTVQTEEIRGSELLVTLSGVWKSADGLVGIEQVITQHTELPSVMHLKAEGITFWDSSLVTFVLQCYDYCMSRGIVLEMDQMPEGVQTLVKLATNKPSKSQRGVGAKGHSLFYYTGQASIDLAISLKSALVFLGEITLSLGRFFAGRAQFRKRDLFYIIQQVGVEGLPIVSLVTFLMGFIMAYIGAVQLEKFGATVFIANLVGLAIVREMGPIMVAIILSGRTGASYAATLGSMKYNQEIDALRTSSISPMDFLVSPRVIALTLMMPLLTIYANLVGITGGGVVGCLVMDIPFVTYLNQTEQAIRMQDVIISFSKSIVFGFLVAFSGCYWGMQTGSSASAVGKSTTSSVVTAITVIILADAVFAFITDVLNI